MKLSLVILALFGCAVHGLFFGCDMQAASGATPGGYGQVACYSAQTGSSASSLVMGCTWKYANLTSTPTLAHFHVGTPATASGPVVFVFPTSSWTASAVGGTAFYQFNAADLGTNWVQQGTTTFPDQVTACSTGCYFNLHTTNFGGGELRCQLAPLAPTASFRGLTLGITPGAVNASVDFGMGQIVPSQGQADLEMAPVGNTFVWGYSVQYLTGSNVVNAHIHQGTSATDNSGPLRVKLAQGPPAQIGGFVGAAMYGVTVTDQPQSYWAIKDAAFDTALAAGFCYINIHTADNVGGEIRANLVNGASQATLALFAIVAMVASFLSL